jgi:hypothetical protein
MLHKDLQLKGNDVLPLAEALDLVSQVGSKLGVTSGQSTLMDLAIRSLPTIDFQDLNLVRLEDLYGFISNLQKAIQSGDHSFLWQKRGVWVNRVVDIVEFVESKEFMGQRGHVRPAIMSELIRFFAKPFVEGVLTGGIGIGKNYFADFALGYMIYLLSVYHNPQVEFDLAPGSSIVFIIQSLTERLAKKVVFDQFAERLRLSPYFTKHFPFNPDIKSELRFPKNIYLLPVGGNDTAAIGMNVFGGLIDELNFMAYTQDSKYVRASEEFYDQAERVYMSLRRRMKSRFIQKGSIPGRLMLVSSINHPDDFTSRKIKEAETDETIFIMNMSLWEALEGTDKLMTETFLVEVGNELKQSRIIESMEDAVDEDDVIKVPLDFKSDFERDVDMALREIGGIATASSHPFIPHRELIKLAQDEFVAANGERQLFNYESCILSKVVGDMDDPEWSNLVNQEYIDECILDPGTAFAVHIDVGISQDALGIAVGRIIGDKLMPAAKYWDEKANILREVKDIRLPFYQIDGILQVTPPPIGEIDLELARDLVVYLRSLLNIKWATMDSYQSTMMIQSFRKMRIRSGVLSVDQSLAPYAELKQSIKDKRIWFPPHTVAAREIREVEKNKKEKIDHPSKGSKDVSDAMAGVVYMLQRKEAVFGRPVQRQSRQQPADQQIRKIRVGASRR